MEDKCCWDCKWLNYDEDDAPICGNVDVDFYDAITMAWVQNCKGIKDGWEEEVNDGNDTDRDNWNEGGSDDEKRT